MNNKYKYTIKLNISLNKKLTDGAKKMFEKNFDEIKKQFTNKIHRWSSDDCDEISTYEINAAYATFYQGKPVKTKEKVLRYLSSFFQLLFSVPIAMIFSQKFNGTFYVILLLLATSFLGFGIVFMIMADKERE